MTDAVFISDAEGRFVEFNDAVATFHRFKNKESAPKNLREYPHFLEIFMPDGTPVPPDMWSMSLALRGEVALQRRIHRAAQGHRRDLGRQLQLRLRSATMPAASSARL